MTESAAAALYRTIEHRAADPRICLPATPLSTRFARSGLCPRELNDPAVLTEDEQSALRMLLKWWPIAPPAGRARAIVDTLAGTNILTREGGDIAVQAESLEALAPTLDVDASWLSRRGRFSMPSLTEVRHHRADLSLLTSDSRWTEDPTTLRCILLALGDLAEAADVASLGGALRGSLAASGVGLHLLDPDTELIAKLRVEDDEHLPVLHLARAMATAHKRGWTSLLETQLERLPDPALTPMTCDDAVSHLVAAALNEWGVDDPLVDGVLDELHDMSWICVARIAGMPALEARLGELLKRCDWSSFDAPGEGDLPDLWRDGLIVAGLWSPHWQRVWAESFEADDEACGSAVDVLRGYSDPGQVRAASAHSSYSHGLHDGTAEAYGDVYSPNDPFSERKHKRDPVRRDD